EVLECRLAPALFNWTGASLAGAGGNTNWNNPNNWSTTALDHNIPQSGDDLLFPTLNSVVANDPRLTPNNNINGLQLQSITIAPSGDPNPDPTQHQGYTLSGNDVGLGGPTEGNSLIVASQAKNNVILLDIRMGGTAAQQFFVI